MHRTAVCRLSEALQTSVFLFLTSSRFSHWDHLDLKVSVQFSVACFFPLLIYLTLIKHHCVMWKHAHVPPNYGSLCFHHAGLMDQHHIDWVMCRAQWTHLIQTFSAPLHSHGAQHSLWMKTENVSILTHYKILLKSNTDFMERIAFRFMYCKYAKLSRMVKISEWFYECFLRTGEWCHSSELVIVHQWIRKWMQADYWHCHEYGINQIKSHWCWFTKQQTFSRETSALRWITNKNEERCMCQMHVFHKRGVFKTLSINFIWMYF